MTFQYTALPVGLLAENCYLVIDTAANRVWIIDPGAEPESILAELNRQSLPAGTVYEILLTHAHVDHIGAVGELAKRLHAVVRLHPKDVPLYRSPENALPPWVPAAQNLPETRPYEPNEVYEAVFTPGHTLGGCCLYFRDLHLLFTGDTLFAGSIGRTDLPGGDAGELYRSIENELGSLPRSLAIAPGHGSQSTLGQEFLTNPYLTFNN